MSKIPLALSSLKISCITCIAASDSATCPPRNCSNPVAWRISFFNTIIMPFPTILLSTSPSCLSPGRLSNMINLHAMNDSRDSVFLMLFDQSLSTSSANVLHNSDDAVAVPKERDVKIFLQPPASRPDGPDPPFVSTAALKMRNSFISSYTVGWTGRIGPGNTTSWSGSLAPGCFGFNIFKVLPVKRETSSDMFSVKSLSAPLSFPLLIIFLYFKKMNFDVHTFFTNCHSFLNCLSFMY